MVFKELSLTVGSAQLPLATSIRQLLIGLGARAGLKFPHWRFR